MPAGSTTQGVGSADSFLRSLLACLLVTGTCRLALAAGGQGIRDRAGGGGGTKWVFGRSIGLSRPSRNRAAGKFRAAALGMMC